MKIYGIVAEYNPFHSGHAYHISETRRRGATHIIAVMSGSVVQRGEVGIFDKHFRAEAACQNGADLVIELPCPYCCASAEIFAKSGISLLNSLGVVDGISFGCETEDISLLKKAAEASESLKDSKRVRELLAAGNNYPSAVSKACSELFGSDAAEVLASPNGLLAVEYIKALTAVGFAGDIMAVKRCGVPHDSAVPAGEYASASYLRELLKSGKSAENFLPYDISGQEIFDLEVMARAAAAGLLVKSEDEILALPDCSPELAGRIISSRGIFPNTMEEFLLSIKAKNMTLARIRRVVLYSLLGIKRSDFSLPLYGRVLAANSRGAEILSLTKGRSAIPVSPSLSKLSASGAGESRLAQLAGTAARFQQLCGSGVREYPDEFSINFRLSE